MTDVEEQLRLYARAITEDRPLVPERRLPIPAEPLRSSGALAVAATLLVVVLIGGAVIALRSQPSSTASDVVTAGDVTTELVLSTDSPTPDEVVAAELTITNRTETDVAVYPACRGQVFVSPDQGPPPTAVSGSGTFASTVNSTIGFGVFANEPAYPQLSLDQLRALVGPDGQQVAAELAGCTGEPQTVAAGDALTITGTLEVGALGLPPGPGVVSTSFFGQTAPPDVSIPITIPEPPADTLTRAQAVADALAEPQVQEMVSSLPEPTTDPTVVEPVPGDPQGTPPPSSGADTDQAAFIFVALPIDDGWQVGYAAATGEAFLVTYTSAGTHIDVRARNE